PDSDRDRRTRHPRSKAGAEREDGVTKLLSALAAIMVIAIAGRARADAFFEGTLDGSQPVTINVDNTGSTGTTDVTVLYLVGGRPATASDNGRLGKGVKFDVFSLSGGERASHPDLTIPKGTRRIIIEVHTPKAQTAIIEVAQNSSMVETVVGGASL